MALGWDDALVTDSPLDALVAEELGSVTFLTNYLQLDFGGARFTSYVWPMVTHHGARRRIGESGYRDALCALIAREVTSTDASPEMGLVIRLGLDEVVINPLPTDLAGPEIAMLQVHEDAFREASLTVWRPDEDVFAGRDWS